MEKPDSILKLMIHDISLGHFCPPEESFKRFGTLPKEPFHEFEDEDLDLMQALEFMTDSLRKWHASGRSENRFGKEYIRISRLIENAVTILGRGLMTLHVKGEDLSKAPVTIDELWKVSSFHYIKSYRGSLVAASCGNEDAFLRLCTNQTRWLSILSRLDRTKRRLETPYKAPKQTQIIDPAENIVQPEDAESFKEAAELSAVSGIGAAHALRPIVRAGGPVKAGSSKKAGLDFSAEGQLNDIPETEGNERIDSETGRTESKTAETEPGKMDVKKSVTAAEAKSSDREKNRNRTVITGQTGGDTEAAADPTGPEPEAAGADVPEPFCKEADPDMFDPDDEWDDDWDEDYHYDQDDDMVIAFPKLFSRLSCRLEPITDTS